MDYVSLSYVLALVYIINFVVLFILYQDNKQIKGLRYWFISSIIGVFAFLSIFLKPFIGDYTAFINNTLILTGFIFLNEGLIQFKDIKFIKNRKIIWTIMIIFAAVTSFIYSSDATRRYLMNDINLSILLILFSVLILYKQKTKIFLYLITSFSAIILMVVYLIRWSLAFTGNIASYDGIHPIIAYVYFAGILFSIVWLITIMLMIQKEFINKLHYLASHDNMTSLKNRREFDKDLSSIFNSNEKEGILYIIDINRFKKINDSHGHTIGDRVIVELAQMLRNCLPDCEIYRIGGDEFAVISISKSEQEIGDRIKVNLNKIIIVEDIPIDLSVSVGSSEIVKYANMEEAYKRADKEMYLSKIEYDIKTK